MTPARGRLPGATRSAAKNAGTQQHALQIRAPFVHRDEAVTHAANTADQVQAGRLPAYNKDPQHDQSRFSRTTGKNARPAVH